MPLQLTYVQKYDRCVAAALNVAVMHVSGTHGRRSHATLLHQTRLNELQASRGRVTNLETERGQLLSEMEGMSISMKAMRLAQEKVRQCASGLVAILATQSAFCVCTH